MDFCSHFLFALGDLGDLGLIVYRAVNSNPAATFYTILSCHDVLALRNMAVVLYCTTTKYFMGNCTVSVIHLFQWLASWGTALTNIRIFHVSVYMYFLKKFVSKNGIGRDIIFLNAYLSNLVPKQFPPLHSHSMDLLILPQADRSVFIELGIKWYFLVATN